jgi:hypothetical protein
MTRFSEDYFSYTDSSMRAIAAVCSDLGRAEVFPTIVPQWLTLWWQVTRATTPVLTHAIRRLESAHPADDFHKGLAAFYAHKIDEESGHDELLVKDLDVLGVTREALSQTLPAAPVAALIGSQYYLIDFYHPAAYLGFIGLLEGYPLTPAQLAEVVKASGAPEQAWSTYRLHMEVDPWHREEIMGMLDRIPEDPSLRGAIVANGVRTADFYYQALEQLLSRARKQASPA